MFVRKKKKYAVFNKKKTPQYKVEKKHTAFKICYKNKIIKLFGIRALHDGNSEIPRVLCGFKYIELKRMSSKGMETSDGDG